jgi:hypothetical protein
MSSLMTDELKRGPRPQKGPVTDFRHVVSADHLYPLIFSCISFIEIVNHQRQMTRHTGPGSPPFR